MPDPVLKAGDITMNKVNKVLIKRTLEENHGSPSSANNKHMINVSYDLITFWQH